MAARTCVYCGGSPLTLEHAWPGWLQEELLASGAMASLRWGATLPLHRVDQKDLQVKVRRVCATCNNGWMGQLEGQAKPLLLPWIRGQRTRLLRPDQQTMAVWAVKTAMMLQFTPIYRAGMVIAGNLYHELFAQQDQPPGAVRVWIGMVDDQPPPGTLLGLRGMRVERIIWPGIVPIRERYLGFEATMIARHLVLKVFGHAGSAELEMSDGLVIPIELTQIWPVRSSGGFCYSRSILASHRITCLSDEAFDGLRAVRWARSATLARSLPQPHMATARSSAIAKAIPVTGAHTDGASGVGDCSLTAFSRRTAGSFVHAWGLSALPH